MTPQPDGSVLEVGSMVNADTGRMTDYEEVWVSLDARTEQEMGGKGEGVVCVVARLEKEGFRGMVVRLGQFCQGVVVGDDGGFGVERWEWTGDGEGWVRKFGEGEVGRKELGDVVGKLMGWEGSEEGERIGEWEVLEVSVG